MYCIWWNVKVYSTWGPQALTVTLLSGTLHFLSEGLIFAYQQANHRINKNQHRQKKSCIISLWYNSNQSFVIDTSHQTYIIPTLPFSSSKSHFSKVILIHVHRKHIYHLLFIFIQFYIGSLNHLKIQILISIFINSLSNH